MSTAQQIYDYYLSRGFQPHQAAAWAAHKMRESGGRHDAVAVGDNRRAYPDAPHGFGVSQWSGPRLAGLVDHARRAGARIPEGSLSDEAYVRQLGRHIPLQTQLDYAWSELQGPERRAYDAMRNAATLEDAVAAGMGYYRPQGWSERTPTMGLGYRPAVSQAQSILDANRGRVAPVSASVAELPARVPDPLRDETRPPILTGAARAPERDESRPPIMAGWLRGFARGGAVAQAIKKAASETDTNPTDAQKEAGNYAKGKVRIHGLEIAIENPKGSTRSGKDKDGTAWRCVLPAHYGDIKKSLGSDGDAVDCYIGDTPESSQVWVVDQVDAKSGRFDEHKCLLCFPSRASALACYEKAFSDGKGKDRIGSVTQFSVSDFKDWLRSGDTTKPAAVATRSGTMSRAGRSAERLARFRGGRVGYADGGEPVPDPLSTMDFTPMTERARSPSVLPFNHRDEARRTDSALGDLAHSISPSLGGTVSNIERLAGTVVGTANELSGIPLAASAGQHMAEAMDRGDPLRAAGAVGEMGLASLPIFAPMRALRPFLPSSTAGRVSLYGGTGAAAGVPIAISDAQAQTAAPEDGLTGDQRKRMQELQNATRPGRGQRTLTRAEREELNALQAQVASAQARSQEAQLAREQRLEEEQRREREAGAARRQQEKDQIEADRRREEWANTPLARAYPWAPAALAAAGATIGGLGGNAITRAGVNRFNTRIDETSGLWGDAVARARGARTSRARQEALDEAESLGAQFQTRLDDGPGGHWPAVATTIAGVEGGLVAPTIIDYVTSTPGSPLRRHVTDSMSTPSEVLGRYGVGLGAGYALGEGLSHFARRRMSEPRNFRGETDALQRSTPPTRLEADPALPPPSTPPALPAPGAGLVPALPPPPTGPVTPGLSSRVAPQSVAPASEPTIIVRGTDSRGRVYHHYPSGATDADGNPIGGRRSSGPKKTSRARRTKGPDDDITPEKNGGRVNRADGGLVSRTFSALRRAFGGRTGYADGGVPDPSEYTDVTDRGLNRAMLMDRVGVDIDAPFGERVAQGFRREAVPMLADMAYVAGMGGRGIPRATNTMRALPPREPSRPSLIQEPPAGVTAADVAAIRGPEAVGEMAINSGIRAVRPPSTGPMDPSYLYGLRDFHRMQAGTMHANGGAVTARADGGPVVSGPIVGPTGGREDALPVSVRSGSFVLPADTVSALGEGNTLKGMELLKARFGGSVPTPRNMGGADENIKILISDGEFVVPPEQVLEVGRGDMEAGHRALEKFVLDVRRQNVKALTKLPKPARD